MVVPGIFYGLPEENLRYGIFISDKRIANANTLGNIVRAAPELTLAKC